MWPEVPGDLAYLWRGSYPSVLSFPFSFFPRSPLLPLGFLSLFLLFLSFSSSPFSYCLTLLKSGQDEGEQDLEVVEEKTRQNPDFRTTNKEHACTSESLRPLVLTHPGGEDGPEYKKEGTASAEKRASRSDGILPLTSFLSFLSFSASSPFLSLLAGMPVFQRFGSGPPRLCFLPPYNYVFPSGISAFESSLSSWIF